MRPLFIGEILIEMGLLATEQVDEILAEQKTTSQKFGQIAVRKGWVTQEMVWEAWARQMTRERRFVDLAEIGVDTAAVQKVTIATARALRVVPLRLWGSNLVVAGAPNLDSEILAGLAEQTHCRVRACAALPESVEYYLERLDELVAAGDPAVDVPMCG